MDFLVKSCKSRNSASEPSANRLPCIWDVIYLLNLEENESTRIKGMSKTAAFPFSELVDEVLFWTVGCVTLAGLGLGLGRHGKERERSLNPFWHVGGITSLTIETLESRKSICSLRRANLVEIAVFILHSALSIQAEDEKSVGIRRSDEIILFQSSLVMKVMIE